MSSSHDLYLVSSSWSTTLAMSDLNCMKYCMTKLWFLFSGRSSSSTFTMAFNRSRNCGAFSLQAATRAIILWTWCEVIFMHVLEFPVKTYRSQKRHVRQVLSDCCISYNTSCCLTAGHIGHRFAKNIVRTSGVLVIVMCFLLYLKAISKEKTT